MTTNVIARLHFCTKCPQNPMQTDLEVVQTIVIKCRCMHNTLREEEP